MRYPLFLPLGIFNIASHQSIVTLVIDSEEFSNRYAVRQKIDEQLTSLGRLEKRRLRYEGLCPCDCNHRLTCRISSPVLTCGDDNHDEEVGP